MGGAQAPLKDTGFKAAQAPYKLFLSSPLTIPIKLIPPELKEYVHRKKKFYEDVSVSKISNSHFPRAPTNSKLNLL